LPHRKVVGDDKGFGYGPLKLPNDNFVSLLPAVFSFSRWAQRAGAVDVSAPAFILLSGGVWKEAAN
jgi:hypothetical protein